MIFIANKYTHWYYQIIDRAKSEKRSLKGKNKSKNHTQAISESIKNWWQKRKDFETYY